jgi:hypothetical protein
MFFSSKTIHLFPENVLSHTARETFGPNSTERYPNSFISNNFQHRSGLNQAKLARAVFQPHISLVQSLKMAGETDLNKGNYDGCDNLHLHCWLYIDSIGGLD